MTCDYSQRIRMPPMPCVPTASSPQEMPLQRTALHPSDLRADNFSATKARNPGEHARLDVCVHDVRQQQKVHGMTKKDGPASKLDGQEPRSVYDVLGSEIPEIPAEQA